MSRSVEPPYQHQGPDPGRKNPHLPMRPELTKDEIRVLKECSTESFWYRCFPLSIAMISASQFAINRGYLTRHPKYGGLFKNIGAGVLAYIIGKFSYQGECRRKILELPDSRLGDAIRKRKGLQISEEMLSPEFPTVERRTGAEKPLNEVYSRMDFYSDKDTTRSLQGLDDGQRPSLDNEVKISPDKDQVPASDYVNYDDLRQKNRTEFQQRSKGPPPAAGEATRDPFNTRPWPIPSQRNPDQQGPVRPPPPPPQKSKPTTSNKYGDVWDE